MNFIYLKGLIKNIRYSHTIGTTNFNKADLIVKRDDGREDILIVKFKEFCTDIKEDKEVELTGNIRSFSKLINGKNKVEIYVFSYFDQVELEYDSSIQNFVKLFGRVCKKDTLRTTSSGKHYIHFIVANNLLVEGDQKLNSYIPCVAWGVTGKELDANFNVGDTIYLEGQLHSREYKKHLDNGEFEIRIAHEVLSIDIQKEMPKE